MKWSERASLIAALSGGFLLGCLIAEWMPWWKLLPIFLAGFAASLLLVWPKPLLRLVLVGIVGLLAAVLYWQHAYKIWNVDPPIREEFTVVGWLATSLEQREHNTRGILQVESLSKDNRVARLTEAPKLALYFPQDAELKYGDQITFKAKLEGLPHFGSFDGRRYWRVRGVQAVVHLKQWEVTGHNKGNTGVAQLYKLRDRITARVASALPGTEGQLLLGLLFGNQGQLPKTLSDQFRALGISHLVAVSGYNLTIISLWPLALAGLIPKRKAILVSALLVLLFVIFTGAPSSIVRAAIMAWVVLFGKYLGRAPHTLLLILLTATMMAFHNPFVVKDDAGFALSFLAFFGLVEIGPLINKYFRWLPGKSLQNMVAETTGAQIATLPYLLGVFGQFSIVAPLANALALPLVPIIMLVGLIMTTLALIPLKLFTVLLSLLYFPLHGFLYLVMRSAEVPYMSIAWPRGGYFPWYFVAVVAGWWLWQSRKIRAKVSRPIITALTK